MVTVECANCREVMSFDQPHRYHAGLGNEGFLYNEAGDMTVVWSTYDEAYIAIVGDKHPWVLDAAERDAIEAVLQPSPKGDRWLFSNPPRCTTCGEPIGKPIDQDFHYLEYPGAIRATPDNGGLRALLQKETADV
jgi:hypothetical protein